MSSAASDSDAHKDAQREIDALKAEVEEWRTKARDAETGKGQANPRYNSTERKSFWDFQRMTLPQRVRVRPEL